MYGYRHTPLWVEVLKWVGGLLAILAVAGGIVWGIIETEKAAQRYAVWCQQQGGTAEFDDDEWECELPGNREVSTDGRVYEDD